VEIPVLNAEDRTVFGKKSAKRVRKMGKVPGVLYDPNQNKLIGVDRKELDNIIAHYGINALVRLQFNNETVQSVIKEVQHDPVNRQIIHIDFKPVDENTKVRAHVPIKFIGISDVERIGGIVQRQRQEVEVECAADKIPKQITVSLKGLSIGQSVKVQDIEIAEELTLLTEPEEVLATLTAPVHYFVHEEKSEVASEEDNGEEDT